MLTFVFSLVCVYHDMSVNLFDVTSRSWFAQLSGLPRAAYTDTMSDEERRKQASKQGANAFDGGSSESVSTIQRELTISWSWLAFLGSWADLPTEVCCVPTGLVKDQKAVSHQPSWKTLCYHCH
jgi:hypothetical protein